MAKRQPMASRISLSIDDAISVHTAIRGELHQLGTWLSQPRTYDLAPSDERYESLLRIQRRIEGAMRLGQTPDFRTSPNASPY